MKIALYAALAATTLGSVVLPVAPVLAAPAAKANYTAPDKSFKVYFRAKPAIEDETEKDPDLGTTKTRTYSEESGALSYIVSITRFSAMPSFEDLPRNSLFDELEKGFLEEPGSKIVGRRSFKVGGFAVRETLVDVGDIRLRMRMVVGRTTLFQSCVSGFKKDLAQNKVAANRFLNSFVILKP